MVQEIGSFHTLQAINVCKSYKSRVVVNSVNLNVSQGEIIGLLGPNGAGKTTCFNILVGLELADSGAVFLNDKNITRQPMYSRARLGLGYLPQEASIFRRLTVEQNIIAILETRNDLDRQQQEDELDKLLLEFKINHIRFQSATVLSGGERRRVEIARAVARDPVILLLDEPFAGVDPIAVEEIMAIIERLRYQGVGILITDHSVRETLQICDRSYIMFEGRVLTEGPASEVANDPFVREHYLGKGFYM